MANLGLPGMERVPDAPSIPSFQFTLPKSAISSSYRFGDSCLTFVMRESTPDDVARVGKLAFASDSPQIVSFYETVYATVVSVGGEPRDREWLEAWFAALGPKARPLIDRAIKRTNNPKEEDEEAMFRSMVPV